MGGEAFIVTEGCDRLFQAVEAVFISFNEGDAFEEIPHRSAAIGMRVAACR